MKHLAEHINECLLLEKADKFMKRCFGCGLVPGSKLIKKFKDLGLDWRHQYDIYTVYEDGTITYDNPKLLGESTITGKAYPGMLNRVIKQSDIKEFRLVEPVPTCADLDIKKPLHFLRAVLNAFPQGFIEDHDDIVYITDMDYTKGDLEKDNQ